MISRQLSVCLSHRLVCPCTCNNITVIPVITYTMLLYIMEKEKNSSNTNTEKSLYKYHFLGFSVLWGNRQIWFLTWNWCKSKRRTSSFGFMNCVSDYLSDCAVASYFLPSEDVTWHTVTNENAVQYRITNHSTVWYCTINRRAVRYRTYHRKSFRQSRSKLLYNKIMWNSNTQSGICY